MVDQYRHARRSGELRSHLQGVVSTLDIYAIPHCEDEWVKAVLVQRRNEITALLERLNGEDAIVMGAFDAQLQAALNDTRGAHAA